MSAVVFNEAEHSYHMDGRRLANVTGVIGRMCPFWKIDPWYLTRGRLLHLACQYADQVGVDPRTIDPEIRGRLDGWLKFRREYPARIVATEKKLGHAVMRYAGTLDRVLEMPGGALCVADLKSSMTPAVVLQLSAYRKLFQDAGLGRIRRGVAVELRENGTYACKWFTEGELRRAESVFLSFLTSANWLDENGYGAPPAATPDYAAAAEPPAF
jgi:hypothetical protein